MSKIPVVVIYRLAEYHCLLSEMLKSGHVDKLTSREIASYLGLSEEIVRKDLSFIPYEIGTPGLGYDPVKLYKAISKLLHVDKVHQVALIGSIETWKGIFNFFDPRKFGFQPVIVFSEMPGDGGLYFDGSPVYQIEDMPEVLPETGVKSAIIACDPMWVKRATELAIECGIKGLVNLTPTVLENLPDDVYISQILLPCEIKLVTYHILEGIPADKRENLKRDIGKRAKARRSKD